MRTASPATGPSDCASAVSCHQVCNVSSASRGSVASAPERASLPEDDEPAGSRAAAPTAMAKALAAAATETSVLRQTERRPLVGEEWTGVVTDMVSSLRTVTDWREGATAGALNVAYAGH